MGELDRTWRGLSGTAKVLVDVVLGWDLDVRGIEHVPRTGGAVLAFNHHSHADVVMVAWGPVRGLGRPVRFLAKAELFEHPATRWLVRGVAAVPVRRGRGGAVSRIAALSVAIESLRAGDLVGVAPEQTISDSFELLPFKQGAARMAIEAAVPIVPVVGWGSQRAFPHDRRPRYHRGLPVVVRYGEPILPRAGEPAPALTRRLRHVMAGMLDEVQRTYPDRPTPGDDWWLPARLGGTAPPHEHAVDRSRSRFEEGPARTGPAGPDAIVRSTGDDPAEEVGA